MGILKIVILEDNVADAHLIERGLKKSGFEFISKIVETRETFKNALETFNPDIILSDYNLPSFDGIAAFRMMEEKQPGIPFIIVSGIIGEENAVELIKNGVTDYVPKNKLFALPSKIGRAMKEAEDKKEKAEANERFFYASQATNDMIYEWKINEGIVWRNDAYYTIMGIKKKTEWGNFTSWSKCIHPEDQQRVKDSLSAFVEGKENFWYCEYRLMNNKGKEFFFADKGYLIRSKNGKPLKMVGAVSDITSIKYHINELNEIIFMTTHKVRQPITNILGLSDMLDGYIKEPDELLQIVDYMKQSANTLDDLTQELNSFILAAKENSEHGIISDHRGATTLMSQTL